MSLPSSSFDSPADEQASLWAARLEGAVLSAPDRDALEEWLAADPAHRPLLSSYCQFSADLEQQMPLLAGIRESSTETQPAPKTAQSHPWRRWPLMAGAVLTAAAAVGLVLWASRPAVQRENIATAAAQRRELVLSDGSHVELNAQTSVMVEIGVTERRVRLASGDAFFSVSKDPARPFFVETPAGSVRVTGTKFEVRAETANRLEVVVVEGSVQARPAGVQDTVIMLAAGDVLSAGPEGNQRSHVSTSALNDLLAWRQGQVVFNDTPLRTALACFARYHGRGLVAAPEVADLRIGGHYPLDDLDAFLADLTNIISVPVQVTQDPLRGTIRVEAVPPR